MSKKNIDDADRELKNKADRVLQTIAERYDRVVQDWITHEQTMETKEREAGNIRLAELHKVRAEVWQSIAKLAEK